MLLTFIIMTTRVQIYAIILLPPPQCLFSSLFFSLFRSLSSLSPLPPLFCSCFLLLEAFWVRPSHREGDGAVGMAGLPPSPLQAAQREKANWGKPHLPECHAPRLPPPPRLAGLLSVGCSCYETWQQGSPGHELRRRGERCPKDIVQPPATPESHTHNTHKKTSFCIFSIWGAYFPFVCPKPMNGPPFLTCLRLILLMGEKSNFIAT